MISVKERLNKIKLIKEAPYPRLREESCLIDLICNCGLCSDSPKQMPEQYRQFFGGLRIWQHPVQLAGYLKLLASYANEIDSYLEIGCKYGGTLIMTLEYLMRHKGAVISAVGIDPKPQDTMIAYCKQNPNCEYLELTSRAAKLDDYSYDLVMIDGEHTYQSVMNDFLSVVDKAKIIVLHDIVSKVCTGAEGAWKRLKKDYADDYVAYEFTQYESTPVFFGIGVLIKKTIDLGCRLSLIH